MDGKKWATMIVPRNKTNKMMGVKNPHTGHIAILKLMASNKNFSKDTTYHNVKIVPDKVAKGIMRGQYTDHAR